MNHDEFMRRTLELTKVPEIGRIVLSDIGNKYLRTVRAIDPHIRALALATYEDGGLEKVFRAILTAPNWNGPLQQAFKHFLAFALPAPQRKDVEEAEAPINHRTSRCSVK